LEDAFNFKPGVSYTYTTVLNASTTAIKVEIGCEIEDWNNVGGGSEGEGDGSEGGEDDGIDLSLYTDLSADGTANCYLIQAAGNYKFKAVIGNTIGTAGNVKKTEVLWESFGTDVMPNEGDLIKEVGYKNGYVYFTTAEEFKNGNASIAVRSSKDKILWSWHIWCSEEGWNDQVYANNAGTMMDRNLGATSAIPSDLGALGLKYQWGRKDPFASVATGNWTTISGQQKITFAEENPMTLITGNSDWLKNDDYKPERWVIGIKTVYDPCPVGYRVPDGGDDNLWKVLVEEYEFDNANKYHTWLLADEKTKALYPSGSYWTTTQSSVINSYGLYLSTNGTCSFGTYGKSSQYLVRCVKEK
jgi:hypothetical protein